MRRLHPLPPGTILSLKDSPSPWVLLDSSLPGRENRHSYLFLDPVEQLRAATMGEVCPLLKRLRRATEDHLWAAGWLTYEAGFALENSLGDPPALPGSSPLAWFGLFRHPYIFDHLSGKWIGESPLAGHDAQPGNWKLAGLELDATLERFSADVERIRELIAAGRTYQVNYTRRWNFAFEGDPLAFYIHLRAAQPVPYSALIHADGGHILSLSPELFFRTTAAGGIMTRPMKGTAGRGLDAAHDRRLAAALRRDHKNRAENLMIVDLLRNDLGRICRTGSVRVPRLFQVERYRSVQQMTSTVAGDLRPGMGIDNVMAAIFPSGSVTGAPKISTMGIISTLEDTPRGVYTGAIGYAAPGGESCFNVAIRTVELRGGCGVMGSGCGIVADSRGADEYDECRLKARFLTRLPDSVSENFRLIETMLAVDSRIALLELHLDRLRDSSRYFGRPFDRAAIREQLSMWLAGSHGSVKVRMLLDSRGECSIETSPYRPPVPPVRIALWPERIDSTGEFFRHKTTNRVMYDAARKLAQSQGLFDFIFVNQVGNVTEGAICNLYLEEHGVLYTPPLKSGVLPGVCRRNLIRQRSPLIRQRSLTPDEIRRASRLWVSNALTGLIAAHLVD